MKPTTLHSRITSLSRELALFITASFAVGMAASLVDSTLNNFLNDTFSLNGFQRSFLEFPREFPGVIVLFVSAALWFLGSRRLGAFAMLLAALGIFLIGFSSSSYGLMVIFLFIYSNGNHLFMPVATTIGMELAADGRTGRRLGQLNAIRNLATIAGSFLVFIGFKFLGFTYQHSFTIAALVFTAAAVLMFLMKPEKSAPPKTFLKLRKEYTLFYALAVLAGSRKQIFITFAPWVIVTIFNKPTQTIATLVTIGGVIGILFQPFLGKAIDRYGERLILSAEALVLIFVCLGYGFSRSVFAENVAFLIVCVCYLLDQMLFSVSMARSTYIKKIALDPSDIQPALSASISIDHVFSISVALLGGVIWNNFGFQYVFLLGMLIAMVNFMVARRIVIPKPSITEKPVPQPIERD
ncbi:MAG TPA: MFS transporter [Anaerolineaceae bacterium]|nr:MFS transporter [Anaerolineaceae bacterium]HQF69085.1 MFS transporter [Anaerolineaceae bacterium]HQK05558.1 MFS transporter [Anaerolineaceae bacterium]HQM54107.1 MFS transporter [Anaerolineaceae bacterium]